MGGVVARGLHSRAWAQPAPGAQAARAAAYLMQGQVEAGTLCPTTMTFAAVPLLQREPAGVVDFGGDWLPALYSREFDARAADRQARRADRHGPDRKAGRFGPARHQHAGDAAGRAGAAAPISWWATNGSIRCRRPMRTWCWPRPTRAQLLLRAALDTGRAAQRRARAPPEGQTGQPQQRQRRGRVRGRLGRDGGRAGPRPVGAAGNGRHHAARLRAGQRGAVAPGAGARITRVIARPSASRWPSSR